MRKALALALGALALTGLLASAGQAAERRARPVAAADAAAQPKVRYYRRHATRARVHRRRVGGYYGYYSYRYRDVINTYGLTRSLYGSINSYRDPFTDRQTTNGPFDHGFFFDSGVAPRGGDSPYLH
jgi:hypothetical protein